MTEICGPLRHLHIQNEDLWGVSPEVGSGSGTADQQKVAYPVLEYGVKMQTENRQADPMLGSFQGKHSLNYRGMPQGQIVFPLYGFTQTGLGNSLAQMVMDWAFGSPDSCEPPSLSAEFAEGPDIANKRAVGLRADTVTLAGSANSGTVLLTTGVMGKDESALATANTFLTDLNGLPDFEYADSSFQLGGSDIDLESFQLTLTRGLQVKYAANRRPRLLKPTQYKAQLQFVVTKDSDVYDAYRRATTATELTGQVIIKGLTAVGSGTYDQCQIDFDRLSFIDKDDQGGKADVIDEQLDFEVLKPDTANNGVRFTWT